ncbi:MAG TPA: hypothetical protein VK212_02335 [Lentimicrobium sp.]|nr:hypothetical protein [Lentimicrobium sp.]
MKNLKELFAEGNLESEKDLNERIVQITNKIQEDYPELTPYLGEMPVSVPSDPNVEVNQKILKDYYDSLYQIVTNHEKNKP